ncbi:MAG: hypothetical protein GC182_03620 [Rhodopseudomonas sp.]|nr:hypothetical protein [Rhodopseudomonas sp.]
MAFGIDDALTTAAAGISLADTVVETIKKYSANKMSYDFEQLIGEARITLLRNIDDADLELARFERTIVDKGIDTNMRLTDLVAKASFWKPFEQHRLSQIQKRLNAFSDGVYSTGDDIAALARCHQQTYEMGISVADSVATKHRLHSDLLNAKSLKEAISILRRRLVDYKRSLGG